MKKNKLISMSENISNNFSAYSPSQQIEKSAMHISQFWTKKMRQDLLNDFQKNPHLYSEVLSKVIEKIKEKTAELT